MLVLYKENLSLYFSATTSLVYYFPAARLTDEKVKTYIVAFTFFQNKIFQISF